MKYTALFTTAASAVLIAMRAAAADAAPGALSPEDLHPHDTELDLAACSIGLLRTPKVQNYTVFDARLGWRPSPDVEVSLAALNLRDEEHAEFGSPLTRSELGRIIYHQLLWRFR